ncbi:MAG: AtpZ/AtpI family protein [Flavobacteriales bacterium]|jgi:uncharacterized membrane protein YiaA|nr:AtpZ/AtpI family protein [Flavobacteriaceae bacterium]MBT5151628.1 AtpZ/AtpI family protein [Flavobacteriales bacterium]MDA0741031.1 AtpZ/AtpI family protein [Bacteroidota bacterium]MDA8994810.1 AtpZ/AtpI family protein [Schleiferiaceae bacterium]MDA0898958.1 AtpZ/AtpI family protein [Bacteroidota bacterium]
MSDKKFMRFSTLGVQMAVLIYLGSELGKYLDEKYASEKGLYTAVCVMAAVGISLYQLVKEMPKDD